MFEPAGREPDGDLPEVGLQEQAGVVAAQVRQKVGGGLEDPGTGVRGTRHGGALRYGSWSTPSGTR